MMLAALCLCASPTRIAAQTDTSTNLGTTFTSLNSFGGMDGSKPFAGLLQAADGNLYGTTYYGGNRNSGEVFEISPDGTLNTIYSFCSASGCTDGEYTYAVLVQATNGGTQDNGTVFRLAPNGGLTTLHRFNGTDGTGPLAGLAQAANGNLYGTTYLGGSGGAGEIFRITPAGTLTPLHGFCSLSGCADGGYPYAGLVLGTDGNLYGTTLEGGAHGYGTVFKITPSGAFTTLYSFCSVSGCTDGEFPQTALVQGGDGNLYGTTVNGGPTALGRSSESPQVARSPRCTAFAPKAIAPTATTCTRR